MTEPRPTAKPPATDEPLPLRLTFEQMVEAQRQGLAAPFSPTVQQITRYREAWWVVYERGWLLITDGDVADEITLRATELAT